MSAVTTPLHLEVKLSSCDQIFFQQRNFGRRLFLLFSQLRNKIRANLVWGKGKERKERRRSRNGRGRDGAEMLPPQSCVFRRRFKSGSFFLQTWLKEKWKRDLFLEKQQFTSAADSKRKDGRVNTLSSTLRQLFSSFFPGAMRQMLLLNCYTFHRPLMFANRNFSWLVNNY